MDAWQRRDSTDDPLLVRLRHIVEQLDPVPELTSQLARSAFSLRSLDSELAELVNDSALHDEQLAGVRGDWDVRMLYYEAADFGVELQVTGADQRRSVLGQVVRGSATDVQVETMAGVEAVEIDDVGRFRIGGLPPGPFRIRLSGPSRRPITTDWVAL
jgi:hypothetical protein